MKSICVQNWDTNGDGELSQEEAAAVTDIGWAFRYQSEILSFNEFQYFTGVTTIPEDGFSSCEKMTSIIIPKNVTKISDWAFRWCYRLVSINIPAGVTEFGEKVFDWCYSLVCVISGIENPFAVSSFGNLYMPNMKLYVPAGTKSKYQNVSLWSSFGSIEEGVPNFAKEGNLNFLCNVSDKTAMVVGGDYSSLKNVTIPESITADGNQYAVTTIGRGAFWGCYDMREITFPDGITTIGDYGFYNVNVNSLSLPSKLKYIGNNAFSWSYNISSLVIPEGVEYIGDNAFSGCQRLRKAELPASLKQIGYGIFYSCDALYAVISRSQNPCVIDKYVFGTSYWDESSQSNYYEPLLATLYIPEGSKAAYEAIEGWTMFNAIEEGDVKEATVDGIRYSYLSSGQATVIAGDYENLSSVTIPSSVTIDNKQYQVTVIGGGAFQGCYQLKTIKLPESITSIGSYAFYNVGITDIALPSTLKTIGNYAFQSCYNLTSISIPEGVEGIYPYTFSSECPYQHINKP